MRAKEFFKQLDELRANARKDFGMGDNSIPKDAGIVKTLENLLLAIHSDVTPKRTVEVELDENGNMILPENFKSKVNTAQGIDHKEPDFNPASGPVATVLPRDPKPVHPIKVEPADAQSVADADLLAIVGD